MTKLVASVKAGSFRELVRLATSRVGEAELVELRVDGLVEPPDLAALRSSVDGEAILTCRSAREGGAFRGPESERLALLDGASALGFEYVDVEIGALSEPLPRGKGRVILSHHDFDAMPKELDALVDRAIDLGADIVKIAARVDSLADTLRLAALGERVRARGREFAPVPLGPHGVSGRILARRLESALAYAPVRGGETTGPGQIPLDELVDLYRFHAIDESTEIYGIVGIHAGRSLSPAMHNHVFAEAGRNAVYVPFEERELERFVAAARKLGVSGLSVTHPFKEAMIDHLDDVDEVATRLGAVNTVVVQDGRWLGSNTDQKGVLEPLARRGEWGGRRAVVVGAGGAARAAVDALVELGARIRVLARRKDQAEALARRFDVEGGSLSGLDDEPWDLLVNATPVGSADSPEDEIPVGAIPEGGVVFDMVTVPEVTPLIRKAREAGARTITGLEMLAAQAVHQQRLWTGLEPSSSELERAARGREDLERYSRQVLFADIGEEGQRRIRSARVLIVGVGALGSVAAEMLARAGVGTLRLVDRDYVDQSNLQRQSLFDERDWREGLPKAVAARRKLETINSDVTVDAHVADVHAGNVVALYRDVDLVLDGTDNFETRYLLNDASVETGVPWIYGACVGSYGMSFVVLPGETPCLRCFLEDEPAPGTSPTCDTAGVLAPAVHAVSAFQVTEALKLLSGRKDRLSGTMLSLDVWRGSFDRFRPSIRREDCPGCGLRTGEYLTGASGSRAVTLCGRNAVQVRPARAKTMELAELAERLGEIGAVSVNEYLLRARLDGREIVLFKDGRAIVHGTEDPAEARSVYARYVGS